MKTPLGLTLSRRVERLSLTVGWRLLPYILVALNHNHLNMYLRNFILIFANKGFPDLLSFIIF